MLKLKLTLLFSGSVLCPAGLGGTLFLKKINLIISYIASLLTAKTDL